MPSSRSALEGSVLRFAQRLVVDEGLAGMSDHFCRQVTEHLRTVHPDLADEELARWLLFARRACVRDVLDVG